MSENPYLPDNLQEPPDGQNSLAGVLSGMVAAMLLQAGLAFFLVNRLTDHSSPTMIFLAIAVTWILSYLLGWALNGQLFSERTLDPDKRQRWGVNGYHSAAEHAQEGLILVILQFVCGALYSGVQALLGRRV